MKANELDTSLSMEWNLQICTYLETKRAKCTEVKRDIKVTIKIIIFVVVADAVVVVVHFLLHFFFFFFLIFILAL